MSRSSDIIALVPGHDGCALRVLVRLHKLAALAEVDARDTEMSDFAELRIEAHRHHAVAEVIARYARVVAEGVIPLDRVVALAEEHHRDGADAILGASGNEIHEARFRGIAAGAKLASDAIREEQAAERRQVPIVQAQTA